MISFVRYEVIPFLVDFVKVMIEDLVHFVIAFLALIRWDVNPFRLEFGKRYISGKFEFRYMESIVYSRVLR